MSNRSDSKASSGHSRSFVPLEYVEAYTFRAVDLYKSGEHEGAITALGKALRLDPDSEPALLMRGALWMNQRRPRKAIDDLSRALAVNCCNADAYFMRAQASQWLGHFRMALADYSKVLRLEEEHPGALLNRAVLHWYFRKIDRAISDFTRLGVTAPQIMQVLAKWGGMNSSQTGRLRCHPRDSFASRKG